MINISTSFGIGDRESLKFLNKVTLPIQLGLYKYEIYEELKYELFDILKEKEIQINVIHLPINILKQKSEVILKMIDTLIGLFGTTTFVIHPNRGIKELIKGWMDIMFDKYENIENNPFNLCIENFQWKRKKVFRSPLEIIEFQLELEQYGIYQFAPFKISSTFDTSHAEEVWFDYRVIKYILKHTSVIHLSNRIGKKQHMPFNIQNGDLNLTGFAKQLKRNFNWRGDIVLEYLSDYAHKLTPNYYYLERLL